MRSAAEVESTTAVERLGPAVGEVARKLQSQAVAGESGTAVADIAGRQLSGPERERLGLRQSRVWQEPSIDRAGPGIGGDGGTQDALYQVRAVDAGPVGGQAGLAIEPGDQIGRASGRER